MEIINLKDSAHAESDSENNVDVPKHSKVFRSTKTYRGTKTYDGLCVTDIKQAVKNENRVNVFVNDEYSFSLDIAQLVDLNLIQNVLIQIILMIVYQHILHIIIQNQNV